MTSEDADREMLERLARTIEPGSKLLRAWELKGGVSAQVTALEIERPDGQRKRWVVRRYGGEDLRQNPHIAADEFRLLRILRSEGLATPAPRHFDQSGKIFPTPCLVMEHIEGEPEFEPSDLADLIRQLATHLARIHRVEGARPDLSFLPKRTQQWAEELGMRPACMDESIDEARIRERLGSVWPLAERNPSVLLHGDFWPGNTLWKGGQLVGIIDWEDAALGDPLADLANSRLEILWAFGIEAMHGFTHQYESMTAIDLADLPYWDLCAALRPPSKIAEWAGGDIARETAMREGLMVFITRAFDELARGRGAR